LVYWELAIRISQRRFFYKEGSTIHFITRKGIVSLILDLNEIKKVKKVDTKVRTILLVPFSLNKGEKFLLRREIIISLMIVKGL
jgi:hypothetical protein